MLPDQSGVDPRPVNDLVIRAHGPFPQFRLVLFAVVAVWGSVSFVAWNPIKTPAAIVGWLLYTGILAAMALLVSLMLDRLTLSLSPAGITWKTRPRRAAVSGGFPGPQGFQPLDAVTSIFDPGNGLGIGFSDGSQIVIGNGPFGRSRVRAFAQQLSLLTGKQVQQLSMDDRLARVPDDLRAEFEKTRNRKS
jgi:hypothetical protein